MTARRGLLAACLIAAAAALGVLDGAWPRSAAAPSASSPVAIREALARVRADLRTHAEAFRSDPAVRASVEGGGVAVNRASLFDAARRTLSGSEETGWLALADPAGTVLAWWGEAPGRLSARRLPPGLSVIWTTSSFLLVERLPVGDPPGLGGVFAGRTLPTDPLDLERALGLRRQATLWAPEAPRGNDAIVLAEEGRARIAATPRSRPGSARGAPAPVRTAVLLILVLLAFLVMGRGRSAARAGLCLAILYLGLEAWSGQGRRLISLAPPILALGVAVAPSAYAMFRARRRFVGGMALGIAAFALALAAAGALDPPELGTSLVATWPSLLRVAALSGLVLAAICAIAASLSRPEAGRGLPSAAVFSIAALLASLYFVSPSMLSRAAIALAALAACGLWARAVAGESGGVFAVSRLVSGTALVTVLLVSPMHESRRAEAALRTASAIRLPNPLEASAGAVVAAVRAAERVEAFDVARDLPAPPESVELSDLAYRLWREEEEREAQSPRVVSYRIEPPEGPVSRFSLLPGGEASAVGTARSVSIERHDVAVVRRRVGLRRGGESWGSAVVLVASWPAWDPLPLRIDAYRRLLLGLDPATVAPPRPFFASYAPGGDRRGEGPHLPEFVRRRLPAAEDPIRVTLPYGGEDLRGEIRREPDGWLLVAIPVPAFLSRFATAALLLPGIALFFVAAGALLLWRIATASPDSRSSLVPAEATTFRGRLVVIFVLAVLVPLFAVTLFLRAQIAARSERLTLETARASLETARRVLDGYLAGFPAGERVARLSDDVLSFVANSVGYDLSAFSGEADLVATSRRDLYAAGLLPDRVAAPAYSSIGLGGAREQVGSRRLAGRAFRDLTTPLPSLPGAPGIRSPGLLSVLLLPQQRAAEAEASRFFAAVSGFSLLAFLLSSALAGRLALRVARPVADLVEGTRAVARGDFSPKLAEPPDAELRELVRAFLTMSQSLRDQTDALSREKERLATLLAHLTAGVVAYREDGLILLANPAAAALGGGDPASLRLQEIFPGEGNEPLRRALMESAGESVTSRELSPRPGERWRLITVPLPLGGGGARMAVIEDVSDVVRSNRLAAWAEMARIIAHEIKNPLTPIRLSVEHLREVWRRGDRDVGRVLEEAVGNVLRQTEELRRSASEFADYARLPEPSYQDVAVRRLLEQAAAAYAAAPGVVWETAASPDLRVRADPRLIARVLSNLLGNSVEALAGRTGKIRLAAEERGGRVEIRVSDEGPGVPPEALPKLFEPYFSQKSGGTGLGLAIARRIVEEHGGTISADNDPSGGLRVTFDLPEAGA